MTDEEKQIIQTSQEEIKKEAKAIADSITHILLLAGPNVVEQILKSMLGANEKIKAQLGQSLQVKFE